MIELTVILKDTERTYRHKHLVYDAIVLSPSDNTIQDAVKEAEKIFGNEYDTAIIKASMVIQ